MDKRSVEAMGEDARSLAPELLDVTNAIPNAAEAMLVKAIEMSASEFHNRELINWRRARSVIEHENNLVNHRITWLLLVEGGLFTAFVTLHTGANITGNAINVDVISLMIACLGIFVASNIYNHLRNARIQLRRITLWWYAEPFEAYKKGDKEKAKNLFDAINSRHPFLHVWKDTESNFGKSRRGLGGRIFETESLPIHFALLWVILLAAGVYHQEYPVDWLLGFHAMMDPIKKYIILLAWSIALVAALVLLVIMIIRRE